MIRIINHATTIRDLTKDETCAGENVMRQCMAVAQDESVLIVTDDNLVDKEAAIFFETAKQYCDNVSLIVMPMASEHAQEPLPEVAALMKNCDIAFLVTTYSLSHTQARHNASAAGARIASMPAITHDIILRTLTTDYKETDELSEKVAQIQSAGDSATITSPNGTNITFSMKDRKAIADVASNPNPGDFCNLPAGEAFIAPVERSAKGVIVFDGCFADIKLDQPVKVVVKDGHATDISGGQAASILVDKLSKVGKKGAYNIAEFGIGTNKKAELNDNLLEVEKVYGTCHIALGNNATFGGEVDVPFHSDGVILKPTVTIDNKTIIKDGVFKI